MTNTKDLRIGWSLEETKSVYTVGKSAAEWKLLEFKDPTVINLIEWDYHRKEVFSSA